MEGWKEGGRMAPGENVLGQRWPDIFFGMGCVLGRSIKLVFQRPWGVGAGPDFWSILRFITAPVDIKPRSSR